MNTSVKRKVGLLVIALILCVVAQAFVLNTAKANPYLHQYQGAPLWVLPPNITIVSPKPNEVFLTSENVTFCCNVTVPHYNEFDYWVNVFFKGDWMINATSAEYSEGLWVLRVNNSGLSLGSHNFTVRACGHGYYQQVIKMPFLTEYSIYLNKTLSTQFVVDDRPAIRVLSLKNETFKTSNITLNFGVDKTVSSISSIKYSLDGKENQTINGNITLTEIRNGLHNVTIYANDAYGIEGVSENVIFNVEVPPKPAPFPVLVFVAVVAVLTVVIAAVGIAVFKWRRRISKHQRLMLAT